MVLEEGSLLSSSRNGITRMSPSPTPIFRPDYSRKGDSSTLPPRSFCGVENDSFFVISLY
jgi:hypothetical protein